MNSYPAFRFGPNGTSVIIHSAEEDSMLDTQWSDKPPEVFDPRTAPTYMSVEHVPAPVDVEAIAEAVKRKPGRPKKAE